MGVTFELIIANNEVPFLQNYNFSMVSVTFLVFLTIFCILGLLLDTEKGKLQ